MDPIIKIGVTTIIIRDGAMLLGRRKGGDGEGEWGLPGGHVEYGESLVEAAKRELEEETGLAADTLTLVGVVNDPRGDCHYIHFSFAANNTEGEPVLAEPEKCYGWEWIPLSDLPENIFVGHVKIISAYKDSIMFKDSE